jgi:hypothetical protein
MLIFYPLCGICEAGRFQKYDKNRANAGGGPDHLPPAAADVPAKAIQVKFALATKI